MHMMNLGGHSGCRIILYEMEDNKRFVRKVSASVDYNARLQKQMRLQDNFHSPILKTPKVLKQGFTAENLFYFDMQYIQGITLAEYMKTIEVSKVRGIVEELVKGIIPACEEEQGRDQDIFCLKISDLRRKLNSMDQRQIKEALEMLEQHTWGQFKSSACHGDLTFDNIIVKDNQLYLIDFLDSFYSSWILDMGALMQDAQALWAYRYQEEVNINTLIRIITFRDILIDSVADIMKENLLEVYYALLLKLVRIYPYIKDTRTFVFLNQQVETVMRIIKQKEGTI